MVPFDIWAHARDHVYPEHGVCRRYRLTCLCATIEASRDTRSAIVCNFGKSETGVMTLTLLSEDSPIVLDRDRLTHLAMKKANAETLNL